MTDKEVGKKQVAKPAQDVKARQDFAQALAQYQSDNWQNRLTGGGVATTGVMYCAAPTTSQTFAASSLGV